MTRDKLDYYPTPVWATEAMLEFLDDKHPPKNKEAFEPCCGHGHISTILEEHGWDVRTNDINTTSDADMHRDFVQLSGSEGEHEWIITNPPYQTPNYHAADFVRRSLSLAKTGIIMLLRASFLEPCLNRAELLKTTPPALELYIPRPRYINGGTDSVTSVWCIWIREDGEWLPMQEDGQDFVCPSKRPPLEERRLPTEERHEEQETSPGFLKDVL